MHASCDAEVANQFSTRHDSDGGNTHIKRKLIVGESLQLLGNGLDAAD
jgi:hypothetical protein